MSKSSYVGANLVIGYDTFAHWLDRTNKITTDMGTYVVTTSNTAAPDITVGNSFINGYFGANVVYVISALQGGTANTAANLSITSGLTVSNNFTLSGVANVGSVYIGNSSVYVTANSTIFSGTANNASYLSGTTLATIQGQITANAATAYSNATSYADTVSGTAYTNAVAAAAADASSKAGTAYSNATAYADTKAGAAYSNATSYADTKAGAAYSNATSYADTKSGTAYSNAVSYVTTGLSNGSIVASNALYSNNSGGVAGIVVSNTAAAEGYVLAYQANTGTVVFVNPTGISAAFNTNTIIANAQIQAGSNGSVYAFTVTSNNTSSNVIIRANNISLAVDAGSINLASNVFVSTASTLTIGNNASTGNLAANSTVLNLGNTTVYTMVNSTAFSGTANNSIYLNGSTLATIQGQITGNAATAYSNAVATAAADATSKAATAYSNATSYADTKAGTAYANAVANAAALYQTTAGLSANVATLTANNANYLGGVAAASYVNSSGAYTISGVHTHSANLILIGNTTSVLSVGNTATANIVANSSSMSMSNAAISGFLGNVVSVSNSAYTFANSDSGKIFEFANASATTVTLPNTAPQGFNVMAVQVGTGNVTFSNSAGSTLVKRSTGANTGGQYAMATLYVRSNAGSAAAWLLGGDTV